MNVKTLFILVTCLALSSCSGEGNKWQDEYFLSIAEDFVGAASRVDTVSMNALAEPDAVDWALELIASEPELFRSAAGELRLRFGDRRADTVVVEFSFPYRGRSEGIGMDLVKSGETWVIRHIQLSGRL